MDNQQQTDNQQSSVRNTLKSWLANTSKNVALPKAESIRNQPCFIWNEPVTLGNNIQFPSYFSTIDNLELAIEKQPERQFAEVIISTEKHFIRLLADTSHLNPVNAQPCLVYCQQFDDRISAETQTAIAHKQLEQRFSKGTVNDNTLPDKWQFIQQGAAFFLQASKQTNEQEAKGDE